MKPTELNEALDHLDGWIIEAGRLESSLRKGGQYVLADHMKSIVDDLVFDRFEVAETRGPVFIPKCDTFPNGVPHPRYWKRGTDRHD